MAACLAAGAHESLTTVLGRIHGHPDEDEESGLYQGGIVTQLIPEEYIPLGNPPSSLPETCAPDHLPPAQPQPQPPSSQHTSTSLSTPTSPQQNLDLPTVLQTLTGLAGCLAHLHARGIAHGAVSAHNILASRADAHALLTGFGAATLYGRGSAAAATTGGQAGMRENVEKVEVLAFGRVVERVMGLAGVDVRREGEVERGLWGLWERCVARGVGERPGFGEVVEVLEGLMGWRGIMRIPDVVPS
jgi:hypothetical protein